MLHYEESVQLIGQVGKDSTEIQEMNHPTMCMGPYRQSHRTFHYK
jgi:hypothetical protein